LLLYSFSQFILLTSQERWQHRRHFWEVTLPAARVWKFYIFFSRKVLYCYNATGIPSLYTLISQLAILMHFFFTVNHDDHFNCYINPSLLLKSILHHIVKRHLQLLRIIVLAEHCIHYRPFSLLSLFYLVYIHHSFSFLIPFPRECIWQSWQNQSFKNSSTGIK